MNSGRKEKVFSTRNLVRMAVLAAIAYVLYEFVPSIPVMGPYKLDFSTVPVLLAGFAMGPIPALTVQLLKDLISGLIGGGASGWVGALADLMMSGSFVAVAGLVYFGHKSRRRALVAMGIATLVMAVMGALSNYFVLFPAYIAAGYIPSMEGVVGMFRAIIPAIDSLWKVILLVTIPFNILKGAAVSAITFFLYKPLSPILHDKR